MRLAPQLGYGLLKPREVIARFERLGFVEVRQRGSHKQFRLQGAQPELMLDPIASFFVPDIKNVVAKMR